MCRRRSRTAVAEEGIELRSEPKASEDPAARSAAWTLGSMGTERIEHSAGGEADEGGQVEPRIDRAEIPESSMVPDRLLARSGQSWTAAADPWGRGTALGRSRPLRPGPRDPQCREAPVGLLHRLGEHSPQSMKDFQRYHETPGNRIRLTNGS